MNIKNLLLSAVALAALATPSFAADAKAPAKAPAAPPPPPAFSWAGLYVLGQVGYGFGKAVDTNGTTGAAQISGVAAGGIIGANVQTGAFVFGVEADAAWANISGSHVDPSPTFTDSTNVNWFGTARLRAGTTAGNALFYVAGGLAWAGLQRVDTNSVGPTTIKQSATPMGWTIGAGVDAAIAPHWIVRGEYLYVGLNAVNFADPDGGGPYVAYTKSASFHVVRVAAGYKF